MKTFPLVIRDNPKISGVVLADQVKSLDWQARCAKKKGKVSQFIPLELKQELAIHLFQEGRPLKNAPTLSFRGARATRNLCDL
jgi:hypothetical protein